MTEDMRDLLIELKTDMKSVKEDVGEIKTQTQLTNGRVNKHDVQLARIWGAISLGAFLVTVAGAFVGLIH